MLFLKRLTPPLFTALALFTSDALVPAQAATAKADIADIAVKTCEFTTLASVLEAAGLIDTLKGKGPYTVFAPNDDAFAKLPSGTVEKLLMPWNKKALRAILSYHVVPGKVMSSDIAGKKVSPATVQGQKASIDASGSAVQIENAKVVQADVDASNGIIHVIDTVMIPKGVKIK